MPKTMRVVGITGGLCTGKTTAARFFARRGAYVFNADAIAHALIKPGTQGYRKVTAHFGSGILKKDRSIDRKKVAEVVFKDKKEIMWLNKCLHPLVKTYIAKRLNAMKARHYRGIAVIEAPLLIEARFLDLIDTLIVVKAGRYTQVKRAAKALRISPAQARLRIARQMPLSKKIPYADLVLDSERGFKSFYSQLSHTWDFLQKGFND